MIPTIYIHIGQHKTGTSTIQKFLSSNRSILYQKGLIYPDFLGINSSHFFAWFYQFGNRVLDADQNNMVDEIIRKIFIEATTSSRNIIISSEVLFSNIVDANLEEIKKRFKESNIKIICYLRRQDTYIESFYKQYLKSGYSLGFNEYFKKNNFKWNPFISSSRYNWYKTLTKYSAVFGSENIIVRPYESQQMKEGNLIIDFLDNIGVQEWEDFTFPDTNENVSLPGDVLELFRLLNKTYSKKVIKKEEGEKAVPYFDFFEHYFGESEHRNLLLSSRKRKAILRVYKKSNTQIARTFLGRDNGELFYDPVNTDIEPDKANYSDNLEIILSRIMEVLFKQYYEIKSLKKKK